MSKNRSGRYVEEITHHELRPEKDYRQSAHQKRDIRFVKKEGGMKQICSSYRMIFFTKRDRSLNCGKTHLRQGN
jgi:hypothetical protein